MGEADNERKTELEIRSDIVEDLDEVERIRASIEVTRDQISHALNDVQDGVQETLDWKLWVKKHPKETIGIAFGIGFLLGRGR